MLTKVLILSVLVCIAHVQAEDLSTSSPEENLKPGTRAKLQEAIEYVITSTRQSAVEVDALRSYIQGGISLVLNPIEKALKILRCNAKKTDKNAWASGKDITDCVKAEKTAARNLDRNTVKSCADTEAIKQATFKLSELSRLELVLRKSPKTCADKGLLRDTCVITIITGTQQACIVLQDEISLILRHQDPLARGECISKAAIELQAQVDKIKADWVACLAAHDVTP